MLGVWKFIKYTILSMMLIASILAALANKIEKALLFLICTEQALTRLEKESEEEK